MPSKRRLRALASSLCTPASCEGRARPWACERRAVAASWRVPAEPTVSRLNSHVPRLPARVVRLMPPPPVALGRMGADAIACTAATTAAAAAAAVATAAAAATAAVATAAAAAAVLASSSASCSEPLNQRIHVNPSRLRGLPERLSSFEGFAELGATEADAHDDDWVARIASSIRGVQFGVLELPQPYAQVYRLLIDPSSYPPAVCAPGRRRGDPLIPITALPPRLVSLSAIWAAVCECICAAVTRELEARTRDTPLVHTTGGHGERRHGSTVNKPCAQRPVCFPAALEAH